MSVQIAVRIPDALATQVDELVASGSYPSRAEVVRAGLEAVVEREQQRQIDEAIVAGYQQHPPELVEDRWADVAGRELIAEEPW